ncbi:unnamed protein product [Mycena citricolor]|uniref:Cyclin N-terminal domain-containing protein n=1 Tax=Mycena citricolor TaxID=2018698 RepID=A0AAD2H8Y4_9AGAR|nr:unnamed protein product [Mycena citricolor]
MSTNIQRRTTARSTRANPLKDNENANARPSRITTRTKPLSNTSAAIATNVNGGSSRVTAPTAASKAKLGPSAQDTKADPLAGKRKRELLGENAAAARSLRAQVGKGKEKEVVVKKELKAGKSTTVRVTRKPLRTVAGTRHNAGEVEDIADDAKEEEPIDAPQDDNAMHVDLPPQPVLPVGAVRKSLVSRENTAVATRQSNTASRRPKQSSRAEPEAQELEEDEEDETRVHKRRRTSDPPEDVPVEDTALLEAVREQAEEEIIQQRIAAEMEKYANEEPEADPENSPWDDLDAADADDPVMVSEYVVDIFNYLKQVELQTMPNPNYMASQTELAWKMRGVLNDWLIQLHIRFRLLSETLFLCTNIIDRFLSARVVSLAKLQLVGVTCMFIAAKFEEVLAPSVTQFLECADSSYTEDEIKQAERYILKTLDWNLSYPNPVHYLRRVSKADNYNLQARTLGKYLLEIACLEWRLIAAPPSLLAAAAIWLARLTLGEETWTSNLAHYSSYPESALLPTANLMLNYILKPVRHEAFYNKYAGKKFAKASVYMRKWAEERWEEGTLVDLAQALPQLRNEIREERIYQEVRLEQEQRRLERESGDRAERRRKIRESVTTAAVDSRLRSTHQ